MSEEKINPYRIAGELHNRILDRIEQHLSFGPGQEDVTPEQLLEITCDFLAEKSQVQQAVYYAQFGEMLNHDDGKIENWIDNFPSPTVKDIIYTALHYENDDQDLKANIKSLNKLAFDKLKGSDQQIILIFLAIMEAGVNYSRNPSRQATWMRYRIFAGSLPWKEGAAGALKGIRAGLIIDALIPPLITHHMVVNAVVHSVMDAANAYVILRKSNKKSKR